MLCWRVFSKFRRYRRMLFAIVIIVGFTSNIAVIGFQYLMGTMARNVKHPIPKILRNVLPYNLVNFKNVTRKYTNEDFRYHWLRMHRARMDWQAILRPCSDQLAWGTLKSGWGKANRSSAKTSFISYLDIQPSGQFSRILIQTQTATGQMKTVGGDFWRVFFTGPASVSAVVFDHQNGTYEAIALLMETGSYTVQAYLHYSLCDGLRDPPEDWFRVGNAQGKYQTAGTLGFLDEYLYEPLLGGTSITVRILPAPYVEYTSGFIPNTGCKKSCRLLWDGHGRWKDGRWWPYVAGNYERRTTPRIPKGTLWIFGDSIGCGWYRSLAKKSLCTEIFASCRHTYNWIYPVPNNNITLGRILNDNFDFRPEIVLNSLRKVLDQNVMKSPHSLLVLNFGLHYPISINFTTFQMFIDDVIRMLKSREKALGPRIIWKTTTSMHKENAKPPRNITHFRFSTEQRVRLFDAYSMRAMCDAGVEVLDVCPLSSSYPHGTIDITHYSEEVFFAAEAELQRYVMAELKEKTRSVCIE